MDPVAPSGLKVSSDKIHNSNANADILQMLTSGHGMFVIHFVWCPRNFSSQTITDCLLIYQHLIQF